MIIFYRVDLNKIFRQILFAIAPYRWQCFHEILFGFYSVCKNSSLHTNLHVMIQIYLCNREIEKVSRQASSSFNGCIRIKILGPFIFHFNLLVGSFSKKLYLLMQLNKLHHFLCFCMYTLIFMSTIRMGEKTYQ